MGGVCSDGKTLQLNDAIAAGDGPPGAVAKAMMASQLPPLPAVSSQVSIGALPSPSPARPIQIEPPRVDFSRFAPPALPTHSPAYTPASAQKQFFPAPQQQLAMSTPPPLRQGPSVTNIVTTVQETAQTVFLPRAQSQRLATDIYGNMLPVFYAVR